MKIVVLLFFGILALLLTVVAFFVVIEIVDSRLDAKTATAMTQVKLLDDALEQYKFDVGYYPSDLQGLMENIDQSERWDGPYIMPRVPLDPWGSEYQYLVPGEYSDFDLYSLGADKRLGGTELNADLGNSHNVVFCVPLGWKERLMAESKGELDMSKGRDFYNRTILLPNQEFFFSLAKREANKQQYDKLRHAGYSPEHIANYVMREKYLPLVRHITGKLNITSAEHLTDDQITKIMYELQLRERNK